jgi:IS30 family transposase
MSNYTHLSKNERQRLYIYLEMGLSKEVIAQKLGRHRSTAKSSVECTTVKLIHRGKKEQMKI